MAYKVDRRASIIFPDAVSYYDAELKSDRTDRQNQQPSLTRLTKSIQLSLLPFFQLHKRELVFRTLLEAMQIWRRAFTTSVARLQTKPRTAPGAALPQGAQIRSKPPPVNPEILGKDITLQGSVRSVRKHKRFAFAELSNGSSIHTIQALLTPAQAAEYVVVDYPAQETRRPHADWDNRAVCLQGPWWRSMVQ